METNFWDAVCLLGTFCLIGLLGISGQVETSSAASDQAPARCNTNTKNSDSRRENRFRKWSEHRTQLGDQG